MVPRRLHPIAGTIAFLTILVFWTSTVGAELFGSMETITIVKRAIPWGFLILVPALVITGASGFAIAGTSSDPRIARKKIRMPFIAGNGLLVLIPAAFTLRMLATGGEFGTLFVGVQAVELVAGAINLTLMSLNILDGLRVTGRVPTAPRPRF
jgi:hypothetical protein